MWANHVLNHSLTLVVKDITLKEAWSGVKQTIEYFQIFGCIRCVHILNVKRTKLEDIIMTCVLFEISSESKGHRLFNPVENKIIVINDVVFVKDKKWDWENCEDEEHLIWERKN